MATIIIHFIWPIEVSTAVKAPPLINTGADRIPPEMCIKYASYRKLIIRVTEVAAFHWWSKGKQKAAAPKVILFKIS